MPKNETTATPETDAWMPTESGTVLEGIVLDLDVAWSDWRARANPRDPEGGNYPILTVETDSGEVVKVHAFRTVLFNEVSKRQPMPGERITLTYLGEGKTPADGGNAPILYRLRVHGRAPETVARNVYGKLPGRTTPDAATPESDVPGDTSGIADDDTIPF